MEVSYKHNDDEGSKQKKNSTDSTDGELVFQPLRLRCPILYGIGSNRFLRTYNFYFLPIIGVVIYSIFLLS